MTDHTEAGYARTALYTVRAATFAEADEYESFRDGKLTQADRGSWTCPTRTATAWPCWEVAANCWTTSTW
jgi:hypothetical protein